MRKPIIAANWKMHKTPSETERFLGEFLEMIGNIKDVEIVLATPFTGLEIARGKSKDTKLKLCGQNVHYEKEGAFTGEISPPMLKEMECEYVIVGHSERRELFGEDDQLINRKLRAVLAHDMKPILCIGETEKQRSNGNTEKVLSKQLENGLEGLSGDQARKTIIAYEPIWAIGTGESARPEDAESGCKFAREKVKDLFDSETAKEVRLQYGGSIKPHNAEELMSQPDLDGGLIGSASLEPESFYKIIETTERI